MRPPSPTQNCRTWCALRCSADIAGTAVHLRQSRAAQIVWTLASPDVGRMLCDVQGWTTGQYADWLEDTLATTLLAAR